MAEENETPKSADVAGRLDGLVRLLRQQGLEIANEGRNGWGNTMAEAATTLERFGDALTEIGNWDCQGDSLRKAYDDVFGKGAWGKLIMLEPNAKLSGPPSGSA